jgi:hypothetical protein
MNVGTKSLLWGVHQFVWHPVTVVFAWKELYASFPNWKELVCIVVHDWGYWGSPNMDGPEGEKHPERGAWLAYSLCDYHDDFHEHTYFHLVLLHSRHYAKKLGIAPSKLCWADKLSVKYEPWWTYLPRARLSGELKEYRKLAADSGNIPLSAPDKEWYAWAKERFIRMGMAQNNAGVDYQKDLKDRVPCQNQSS